MRAKVTALRRISISLLVIFISMPVPVAALDAAPQNSSISELVAKLRQQREPLSRYELASSLPELVERDRSKAASPMIIDQIGSLLDDPSDGVRGYAASALGLIGAPAAQIAPHLVEALKRGEAEFIHRGELRPSSFSGDQICQALLEIGVTPMGAHCENGLYRP